ncbi:MAG: penicillin acylase family protein, partial [Burkholderiaceae bacterium]
DNPAQYQTPSGWAEFTTRTERFAVKGEADVERVVLETRHGPVLSGIESIDKTLRHPGFVLALRWSALEADDRTVSAILGMNRATNAAEFRRAIARFDVVTQSAVYADIDGEIGFFVTGRIPIRARDNDFLGRVPALGWEARFDWQGFLPGREVPQSENPANGWLLTANNRITPPDYPHHLTHDWFTPYRARRIESLLGGRAKHDVDSMRSMQADVVSLAARELMPLLASSAPQTTAGQDALTRLLAWDGAMAAERPEPLLFHAWMRELKQRVFADDLGDLAPEFVGNADLTRALLHVLSGRGRSRDWCDDRSTAHRIEGCQTLGSEALDAAVVRVTSEAGVDVAGLRWGDAHRAIAEHRPLSNVWGLGRLFELEAPYPGDTFTVNVGALSNRAEAPFTTRHAASLRMIVDLGAPAEKSLWIQSTGQSGNALSARYSSMLQPWRDVKYVPMRAATDAASSVLELTPR